ncbi:glycosyltransferase family 10 [Verrucomicrobium sp. BvORR034]|uniref:glycosyltransferase family 10 domain-containing protein n=1 Tax=Verrucomicrobium sp. BvORR034 TaxID=1396418 RepID=UPI000679A2C7|nr:glycosyltransferase family 10 [Verrucomicrobium sp. BvORR034]
MTKPPLDVNAHPNPIRVKIIAPWCSDAQIHHEWRRYARAGGRWNHLQLVMEDPYDVLVVHNYPDRPFDPARTLVYQHEPSAFRAAWPAPWHDPPADAAALVHTIDRHHMPIHWYVGYDRDWEFLTHDRPEKSRTLSAVISGKDHLKGGWHRARFVREHLHHIIPHVDLYGRWPEPPSPCYLGMTEDKSEALRPYRYTIACENCYEPNYFTEKITDAIVSETLAFYSGCPNLEDFFDPECFVRIDLSKPKHAVKVINEAIAMGLYEQRIDSIRRQKRAILDRLSFFPMIERHISDLGLDAIDCQPASIS